MRASKTAAGTGHNGNLASEFDSHPGDILVWLVSATIIVDGPALINSQFSVLSFCIQRFIPEIQRS